MKKYVLLTAMVAVLAAPGAALSQNFSSAGGSSANSNSGNVANNSSNNPGNFQGGGRRGGGGQGGNGQQFQTRKAEILRRISQRQSCVQAANDRQALEACMPQRGGQGGGNGFRGQNQ